MARAGYMQIQGKDQGEIQGSVYDDRYGQGLIKVLSLTHQVERPGSSQGSLLSSSVNHLPLELIKPIDAASPLLNQALCEQEALSITLTWYQPDEEGQPQPHYQLLLENAQVQSLTTEMPDCRQPEQDRWHFQERLRLVYQQITWRYGPGGEQEFQTLARRGQH